MNKSDLIERIVEKGDYPLYIVEDIVNAVFLFIGLYLRG